MRTILRVGVFLLGEKSVFRGKQNYLGDKLWRTLNYVSSKVSYRLGTPHILFKYFVRKIGASPYRKSGDFVILNSFLATLRILEVLVVMLSHDKCLGPNLVEI